MEDDLKKILKGYKAFREKYTNADESIMYGLHRNGQQPKVMVIACCDARVDPALILQCDPGDLFVVRNVANIIPPYEKDTRHHGTSAALEFGICFLNIAHLIILGHSQCGGIKALLASEDLKQDDFITNWVALIKTPDFKKHQADDYAKLSLAQSYQNAITFPWIKERTEKGKLTIHLWFFDIQTGQIYTYSNDKNRYEVLLDVEE
ncbi:MAG: carbonic anhydrase [Candidatus Cardinium sp.]|uniref:carbonic anhydrase n=1 Tax=Cardinium endosymbiont of Dermatophagoides farinae TaxID=2597823 RepID=UPI001184271F|nr:carbonic anhydrase [Cardinium endosymbiont of Dermatophagoides farinae]TSJ81432.1 carbonic anhydrase [Cardinium endosymbiont of Dermatophagoides farinae]UWW97494.1 MAG: carbonic anhydrase [Candidatus Cardinium sp.]